MECAGKGRGTRCLGPPKRRCERCGAVAYCSASHQGEVSQQIGRILGQDIDTMTAVSAMKDATSHVQGRRGNELLLTLHYTSLPTAHLSAPILSVKSYLSIKILHWTDHKEECRRLKQQMQNMDVLNDFPFTFSLEATLKVLERKETRCSFLSNRGIHQVGMWLYECCCGQSVSSSSFPRSNDVWHLPSVLCPCNEPVSPISKQLSSWNDYYDWRCIPLHSPVALLLHWPLTVYHATQVVDLGSSTLEIKDKLYIHYLGPEKELLQLAVFAELFALFPGLNVHVELVGPAIPENRDDEKIDLCNYAQCLETDCICKSLSENLSSDVLPSSKVTLQLRRGFYHDRYRDIAKDFSPHVVIAPNAGIAAYSSWLPTIELINEINVPAIFSDYCEEACHLGAGCLSTVTGRPPRFPIQINPFRQPMVVENSALFLPCYSNCFLYGM